MTRDDFIQIPIWSDDSWENHPVIDRTPQQKVWMRELTTLYVEWRQVTTDSRDS